jgi:GT2 family glycosyltransferase
MVDIITLNYNQNDYTVKCILSLLESDFEELGITLVDNGSTFENYEELKQRLPSDPRLRIYRLEENKGYVGGINFGLEVLSKDTTKYIVILNNDTVIDKKAIFHLVETSKKFQHKAIITGKVFHYDQPNVFQDVGYSFRNEKALKFNRIGLNEIDKGQYDEIAERDMLDDVFWLFPYQLYKEIGGYSPYFWFNAEQADFALRAKKRGYKLIYTPKAKLWHKGSVSIGGREKNPRLAFYNIQSTLIFRYRHLGIVQFLLQYFKILIEIIVSYIKVLSKVLIGKKESFKYTNAKFLGLCYFNKWFFIRNENNGYQPY